MKRFMIAMVTAGTLLAGVAQAQSVAGEWDAEIGTPGGVRNVKLVIKVNGNQLTGVVQRALDTIPLTGTVKADTVTYSYVVNYEGNPLEITVTARLSGDAMEGTVSFGGMAEGSFAAKRARKPGS